MALKRRHALLGSRKGILLTLFTIVLFILMLSELVTYVVLNINYGNLETQAGRASSTGSMVQDINSSLSTFLQSSLSGALSGLTYYESTPSVRKDSFINSTSTALATIMETGTYNSYSLSGYEGTTLSQYITALTKQASSQGASISITNGTLSVFQGGAFAIIASYTAMLTVNQSGAISNYPIDAIASVSTAARQYLPGAEQGIPSTLVPGTSSPNATLVGNMYAKAGSTSPYMFAYGTVVYYPGEPNCGTIASGYKSSSYILATPDAADIGQSVCGMAGLVANTINASTPIMPYLLYNNASIMSYLQNSPSLLLDGQGLALLNTTPLQQAVQYGYAYASPYMPTYLQRAQSSLFGSSPNGFYTFSPLNVKVAQFNGASSYISTGTSSTFNFGAGSTVSITAWIYPQSNSAQPREIVAQSSSAGYAFDQYGSQLLFAANVLNPAVTSTFSTGLAMNTWNFVGVTYNDATGTVTFYTDALSNQQSLAKNQMAATTNTLCIGKYCPGNINYADGSLSNIQIYNTALTQSEMTAQYNTGISGAPIKLQNLIGWWPLNGNANDYSGNGNNGVATNVIYTSLLNSPTANLVEGVLNCTNLDQCSNTTLQHLYLNPLPLEHAGMGFMNETTSLGMMNAALPDALSFNGISDYVSASGNPISGTGAFTLTAWIDAQPMSNYGGAFTIGSPSSGESAYIGYVTTAQAGASNSIGGGLYGTNIGSGVTSKGWHFVALTFSGGTSGSLILYVDGVEKTSTSATPDITGTSMLIGTIQSNTYFFNGSVADVQLYNSALSTPQVQQLYLNNSVPGVAPIDYWPLGTGINGLLNETPDIVGGKTGYFYGNGAACTNSQVVNGQCGPSYTPP